jgi:hypothetical protein
VTAAAGPLRRLELDADEEAPARALQLLDPDGSIVLQRTLDGPLPPAASPAVAVPAPAERCEALAEIAASVVARYLREIGYHAASTTGPISAPPALAARAAAPAPESGTTVLLGAGAGGRVRATGGSPWTRGELLIGVEAHRRWLALSLAGGVSSAETIAFPATSGDGALLLRAFPARAALSLRWPVGPGLCLPAVGASLDWISFHARGLAQARAGVRLDPGAELGLAYLLARRGMFVRGFLFGGVALAPRDFTADRPTPVFRTPGGYLRAGIDLGVVLGKKTGPGLL